MFDTKKITVFFITFFMLCLSSSLWADSVLDDQLRDVASGGYGQTTGSAHKEGG